MKREAGFSALEALAALAIVAIALIPLISLQIQVTRDHVRHQAIYAEATATHNALALLREVNPMSAPAGEIGIGDSRVRWRATPQGAARRTTRMGSGEGGFLVQIYNLQVEVLDPTQATTIAFEVDLLGWRALSERRVPP